MLNSDSTAAMPLPTPYGSDRSGVVCAYSFRPGLAGTALRGEEIDAWLALPPHDRADAFAWLHFDLTNVMAQKWMRSHLELPSAFFDSLEEGGSSRVEVSDGSLIAVINDVLFDFDFEAAHVSTLWVCASPGQLTTARRKPLRSIERVRMDVRDGGTFRSALSLLVHLLHDQGDVLTGIVRTATARVDATEDSLLAGRLDTKRASLGGLRRVLVRLRRLLAPEPASLFRLLAHPPAWIADDDVQDLRHATEEFGVTLAEIATLLERVKLLQEEIAAEVAEQNNHSLFLLTVFTVLALPINIIAGLFGMNVGGIPLARDPHGFWAVVGVAVALTGGGLWLVYRRRRE